MIRVLHLLDHTPDFQTEFGAAMLAHDLGANFSITRRTIGPGGNYRNSLFASFLLRETVARDVDIVHAWGEPARIAAVSAGAKQIIFSPVEFPIKKHISRLIHAQTVANVYVACPCQSLQDIYLAHGIPADQMTLIRPGADLAKNQSKRDDRLRQSLGFSDGDYVLLAPGESTRPAGHHDALWAASILHVLDPSYRFLIWGRGSETLSCVRLAEKFRQPGVLTVAQWKLNRRVEFAELLPAADAAVHAPAGPTSTLGLTLCMTAGLPIVATPTPVTEELLKDWDNGFLVARHAPRLLSQSVMELRQQGRSRLSTRRSVATRKAFGSERFVSEFRQLYRLAAMSNAGALSLPGRGLG